MHLRYTSEDLRQQYPSSKLNSFPTLRISRKRPCAVLAKEGSLRTHKWRAAITKDSLSDVADLTSNHEEADNRMLIRAKYVANPEARIIIQSPDTNVLFLSASHLATIASKELWFRTGVKDCLRFVPVRGSGRRGHGKQ